MWVKMNKLEPEMDLLSGSLGKEYDQAVYCHPANLTYIQSTSCEMLGWMNHSLNQGESQEKYQQSQICR